MKTLMFAIWLLAAVGLTGCSNEKHSAATPTTTISKAPATVAMTPNPSPTSGSAATPSELTATPTQSGYYPTSFRTGTPEIDVVLDAIFAADSEMLTSLFEPTPSPCVVKPQGIHNPPACPDGVAGGTLLPIFRAMAGEAVWPDYMPEAMSAWLDRPHAVYAVFRAPEPMFNGWIPDADYAIVLADLGRETEPWFASEVRVTDGRITSITFGGSSGVERYVEGIPADRFILAPR